MAAPNSTVIAVYSRRMRLRLDAGSEVDARIRGKQLRPVCGDRVLAQPIRGEADWLITSIGRRATALTRPNRRAGTDTLAANFDLLVVVTATVPRADWSLVDRYLCAAELLGIPAVVVCNKTDLGDAPPELGDFRALGYSTVACSAKTGGGIGELQSAIDGRVAIVVGFSGVGKSSLTNALIGVDRRKTAAVSAKTQAGRHTTVNSAMLPLPGGGQVIDSPGVRDYSPVFDSGRDVASGFREIRDAAPYCRFADCRHVDEPECAVKAAVDGGRIALRRYASYLRSLELC